MNVSLLEQCFLPRLLLSPIEAFYCFKMLKFLHTSGAPNFRTVGLLDQLFREQRITALIFQCTSKEADNLGHFLNETLRDLGRWHADKAVYEKEAERRRTSLGLLRLLALTASQRHSWSTRISVGYCTNGTACWPLRSKSAWAAANICTSGTQSVCSKQLCSNSLLLTGLAVTC